MFNVDILARISSSPGCPPSWTCPWTGAAPAAWTGSRSASPPMTGSSSTPATIVYRLICRSFEGEGVNLKDYPTDDDLCKSQALSPIAEATSLNEVEEEEEEQQSVL